jgi:hypothetical protein
LTKQHHDNLAEAEALVGVLLDVGRGGAGAEAAYRAVLERCWRRTNVAPSWAQVVRVCTAVSRMETPWLNLDLGATLTVDRPTAPGGAAFTPCAAAGRPL